MRANDVYMNEREKKAWAEVEVAAKKNKNKKGKKKRTLAELGVITGNLGGSPARRELPDGRIEVYVGDPSIPLYTCDGPSCDRCPCCCTCHA